jgi:X-X-X-Leu-X-X-Gly heptad repeat protein
MLQISLTLDTEKCSDIASEGATIAASGKSKVISHTVMPGKDADISITTTVENFSMGGVEVAGMPFSMSFDIPDTGEMLGEMTTLSDAIDELNTGAGTLASGVRELEDGTAQLVSGSAGFSDGLAALAAGGPQLTDGSAQIDEALAAMAAGLKGTGQGGIDLGELGQLPATLRQLSQGLQAMSAGIVELKTSYDGMLAGLDALIAGIPALSQEENEAIGMLLASLPDDAAKANLAAVYTAALTLQGGYTTPGPEGASLQQGLAAVSTALDVMANGDAQDAANTGLNGMVAALNAMADGIESALQNMDFGEQLGQLASGLSKLSKEYGQFHIGLVEYTGGVQQLAGGYGALHGGLAGLHEGTAELASGTQKLHNGTTELNDAVADLPDTMQLEIDKLLAVYEFDDFTPVSFTSPKNTQVALVQFVLMTEGIVLEEEAGTAAEEGNTQSIWDRFLALFNTDKE